jgi:hypothetical protein
MIGFLWLFLAMALAGIGVPGAAVIMATFGLSEPFSVIAFGRQFVFKPWQPFPRKKSQYHFITTNSQESQSTGVFAFGYSGQYVFATIAIATVVCAPLLLNEAVPFKSSGHRLTSVPTSNTGQFVVANA